MKNEIVIQQPGEVALPQAAPSAGDMLHAILSAIKSGEVTAEKVAAMDGAMKLCERMQERESAKQFAEAFVELMREMPTVKATKIIPSRDGTARSSFAPFEEIDNQSRPLCLRHGFTYSFSEGPFNQGRITKICTLTHVGGHSRQNPYTVRIGQGPPGCSESQADGSAHSYAKRGALCDALNIVVHGIDNDARNEGAPITAAQATELESRVTATGSNREAFLKLAGAPDFQSISAAKLSILESMLERKERKGK